VKTKKLTRAVCIPLACVCVLGSHSAAAAQTAPAPAQSVTNAGDLTAASPFQPASTASIPAPAFSTLFGDTIQDFRRLPSRDSLNWLAIGAVIATTGRSVDRSVSQSLSTSTRLENVFEPGKTIGGARLQLGAAAATYAIGRMTGSPKIALVGRDLLKAQIITQTLTAAIKMSVRRTRPDDEHYSFPSGHASVTFATATVLHRDLGWKVGIPAYGIATYVAASRIQEKRHFLSDVAFGAAIGIIAGRTVTVGRGDARFTLAPVATDGGAALSFKWVGRQ
jgi:membrane-associated phospholipid phosphatase